MKGFRADEVVPADALDGRASKTGRGRMGAALGVVVLCCVIVFLTACHSSTETSDGWNVGEDSSDQNGAVSYDRETVIPPGELDWAPDELPVRIHTPEDSRATEDQWRDIYHFVTTSGRPPGQDTPIRSAPKTGPVALQLMVPVDIDHDDRLDPLERFHEARTTADYPPDAYHRYIGLGPPFTDDYLHLFNCTGVHEGGWLVGDVLFHCYGGGRGLFAAFLRDPSSPAGEKEPEVNEEYLPWYREIVQKTEEERATPGPHSERAFDYWKTLDLYVWRKNFEDPSAPDAHARTVLILRAGWYEQVENILFEAKIHPHLEEQPGE